MAEPLDIITALEQAREIVENTSDDHGELSIAVASNLLIAREIRFLTSKIDTLIDTLENGANHIVRNMGL